MKYIRDNWKFLVIILIICTIGGYFTTLYSLNYLDQTIVEDGIRQVGSRSLLIIISVVQILIYTALFSCLGLILANKVGLWQKIEKKQDGIKKVLIISLVGGLVLSVFDRYVFGNFIEPVLSFYEDKPSLEYIISCFTYGAVFEEILLRLFIMTLLVWIIKIIFYKKENIVPIKVFVIANIVSALLFAIGHLPSTSFLFGYLDFLIIFRCFLLNGAFGIALGWLYRKYGICYSMLAHFGIHFISKLIWLLFI